MFVVLYKDTDLGEVDFKFKGFLQNDIDDLFVVNSLKNLGWDKANVKLYKFDKVKFKKFMKWNEYPDNDLVCRFDSATLKMNKHRIATHFKAYENHLHIQDALVAWRINYFTQAQIDDYLFIDGIYQAWLLGDKTVAPDYQGKIMPASFFGLVPELDTQEVSNIEEFDLGVLVDVDAKILDEDAKIKVIMDARAAKLAAQTVGA